MAKILIIEDDSELSTIVMRWLKAENFTVELCEDGNDAASRLQLYSYDLIILDWNLPGKEGVDVLSQFRARGGNTPVLMLTGRKNIDEKLRGFDSGADDYLTKPFNGKELTARVRALLKRPTVRVSDVLRAGDLELDTASHTLRKNGIEIKLLPKEIACLEFFMRHPTELYTSQALLAKIWSNESDATTEAVTTCIKRLRKKLDEDGKPSVIRNVHGVGYGLGFDDAK